MAGSDTNRAVGGQKCPTIALVVPCYNEEAMLPLSAPVLLELLDSMVRQNLASEESFILAVDDGSTDTTWNILSSLHSSDKRFKSIRLSHNRGQQNAIFAGLMTVRSMADAAVTVDADLQDSTDAIIEMVRLFNAGADIVYGVRNSRTSDSWFKRTTARAFYKIQQNMGLDTVYDHSEFRLMSRRALDILARYDERNLYIRGLMRQIGLNEAFVYYERAARAAGETKFSFFKLLSLSIDGITSFTARPMRLIFLTGLVLLLIDIIVAVWVFVSHFYGYAISGWSSLMLSVWFLGSLVLISLGIIGEYIGKIFVEVKRRPRYSLQDKLLD